MSGCEFTETAHHGPYCMTHGEDRPLIECIQLLVKAAEVFETEAARLLPKEPPYGCRCVVRLALHTFGCPHHSEVKKR